MNEDLFSELQEAYLELSGYVGVLNLLVAATCAQLIQEKENPQQTFELLETSTRDTIKAGVEDPRVHHHAEVLRTHLDAADHLFNSIRNCAGLGDVSQPSE